MRETLAVGHLRATEAAEKKGGREGGREGEREGGRERGREGGRERGREGKWTVRGSKTFRGGCILAVEEGR